MTMKRPMCPFDGKECTGKFVFGAPSCDMGVFDSDGVKTGSRCPRLK